MLFPDFLSLLLIAVGLSADCFAVSLSGGAANRGHTRWQVVRTALSFGFFQAMMPLLGWLAGRTIVGYIESFDNRLDSGTGSILQVASIISARVPKDPM